MTHEKFEKYLKISEMLKNKNPKMYIGDMCVNIEYSGLILLTDKEIETSENLNISEDEITVTVLIGMEDDIAERFPWIGTQGYWGILRFHKETIDKKRVYQELDEIEKEILNISGTDE